MKYTNEEIIKEIQRVGEIVSRAPTQSDMNKHSRISGGTAIYRFGSWNGALQEAGFSSRQGKGGRSRIPTEDLICELVELENKLGRTPSRADIDEHGNYHSFIYYTRFGSLNNAKAKAGIDSNEVGASETLSTEVLIDHLLELEQKLGHAPSKRDVLREGKHSPTSYRRWFDGFSAALKAAGFDVEEMSGVERSGAAVLAEIGLKQASVREKRIAKAEGKSGYFWADRFLPNHDIVIEFDGGYQHGHPDYKPYNDRQKKRIKKDQEKDDLFAEKDLFVIRIWGSSLRNFREDVITLLQKAIKDEIVIGHGNHLLDPEPDMG